MEKLAEKQQMSLQECLEDLQEEIIFGKNSYNFRVYPIETSGGKTYRTIKSLRDSFKSDNKDKRRYIFVTKFKDEALRVVNEINECVEETIAMFYTPDKNIKDKYCSSNFFECSSTNTLIITHAMYCKLCNPKKVQHEEFRKIIKTYKTLIIDEEINPIKESFFEFSESETYWINVLESVSQHGLAEKYYKFINPLMNLLKQSYKPNNQLHRVECDYSRKEIDDIFNNLVTGVGEINDELFEDRVLDLGETKCTKTNLLKLLDSIYMLYDCIDNNVALIRPNRNIYSYDYTFKYLMLDNNIWLDASAKFNTMYNTELFEVIDCPREIDHTQSQFKYHKLNTSTSSKNNDDNFRKDISKYIKENYSDKPTLILSKKAECQQLKAKEEYLKGYENFKYLNFESMRGVDDYKKFEVCCYIHTYRFTPAYYVFVFEYFNDVNLADEDLIVSSKQIKFEDESYKFEWGFEKKPLYDLLISDMASSMYQGLKRVQRCKNPKAIFDVFTSSISALKIVLKQLNGVSEDNFTMIGEVENKVTDRVKLIDYIDKIIKEKGKWIKIKSSEVMEELEINKANWSKIWNNEDFIKESKLRRITQKKLKAGGQAGNRLVNWMAKY
jgi:hypothetical protein